MKRDSARSKKARTSAKAPGRRKANGETLNSAAKIVPADSSRPRRDKAQPTTLPDSSRIGKRARRKARHVLGLSGGKDSAALAVLMHERVPEMEYFFCDTKKELPETYEYLDRIRARLGIHIEYLAAERGFDHWLDVRNGTLPSPRMRWCTEELKILPIERWIGDDEVFSYIGIRADENRDGYISAKPNIKPKYPFKEMGLVKSDVLRILDESGIGLPSYYKWRTRSGCFFCFFQRKAEWIRLHDEHEDLFWKAVAYEENHRDGRQYTWTQNETLRELLLRRDEILADHQRLVEREQGRAKPSTPLAQVLAAALDEEDDSAGCLVCHV
jgi:3'-phosphoadenosine 5'-phosphosulfate sulfotransferase (PAPS reductase)/FAD synthetase